MKRLAHQLPSRAWRRIEWREGSDGALVSRFVRVRVRPAHRNKVHPEEWLVIEWPLAETEPTKYWLATLPESIAFKELVLLIKLRWRLERDYQELKQELGLGHYEGRNWRGFHHHATLTIAAYGFLMRARLTGRAKKTLPSGRPSRCFASHADRRTSSRTAPLVLPERHTPDSIRTMRIELATLLVRTLPICPCCRRKMPSFNLMTQ